MRSVCANAGEGNKTAGNKTVDLSLATQPTPGNDVNVAAVATSMPAESLNKLT